MPPASAASGPVLLACDLDGTLLDHEATPVPGVAGTLAELTAAGVLFVVCTGRPLRSARRATRALGVEPVVYACYHGALIADASGRLLRHQPLPKGPAGEVAAAALAEGVAVTVWDVDEPRELEPGADELEPGAGTGTPAPGKHAPLAAGRAPGDQVSRLVLHGDPATVARLLERLQREWAGRLRVRPIRPGFIGVFAAPVDKGAALRFIAAHLRAPLSRAVACGDGEADETLLRAAAVRIAVGEPPHVLGHVPGAVVTSWAGLPETLRTQVGSML